MIKIINPDGCTILIIPVSRKYFRLTRALMGRKASTPGGLLMVTAVPDAS